MSPTPTQELHRLPVTQVPSRGLQILKGLTALVGAIAIVVGVPIGLLAAFGTPWPDERPSLEWLTQSASPETVMAVLAAIVWLAWAHFVFCLIVEAVAEVRHRGLARPVPGGSFGTQALARRLISAILLLGTAAGIGMTTATAATAAPIAPTTSVSAPLDQPAETAPQTSLQTASIDLPGLDDLDVASADEQAESGLTTYYDVKPPNNRHYDTLWDIADRYLGDGMRYKEIWDLNKGLQQPDGRVLTDADLILPGWVMKMPNDAKGPGLKVIDHEAEAFAAASAAGAATAEAESPDAAAETGTQGTEATADQGGVSLPSLSIPENAQPVLGVAGGLAFAGLFLAWRRREASRTLAERWARRRSVVAGPDPDTDPDGPSGPTGGRALSDEVDLAGAEWLDSVLRDWTAEQGSARPSRMMVSASGVAIAVDGDAPAPQGWRGGSGSIWTRERKPDDGATTGPSACPALVCLGQRPDATILLWDLESVDGIVGLVGDGDTARGTALSIAVDMATHPWADDRRVHLVGFATDLRSIAPDVIRRTNDVGRVLDSLANIAGAQRGACRAAGVSSVREARLAGVPGDWTTHVVVCSGVPSEAQVAHLTELASDPLVAISVVMVGATDTAVRLTARADGRLVAPQHAVDVRAQVLGPDAADHVVSLFAPVTAGTKVSLGDVTEAVADDSVGQGAWEQAVVEVDVLGSLRTRASGPIEASRAEALDEALVLLALHPEGLHVNLFDAHLWPRGVEGAVRDNLLDQLQAWLGDDADGQPVLRRVDGVVSLAPGAVRLDWDVYRDLLNRASRESGTRLPLLDAALDLVRGLPFADTPAGRFGWLAGTTLLDDMVLAVALTAQSAAEIAASEGDEATADRLLRNALQVAPANEELWRSRLRLARAFGDDEAVRAEADAMYAAIARHGSPMGASAQTDGLVDDLLPGYRNRVA